MISLSNLLNVLHAVASGHTDRALNLVVMDDEIEEADKRPLHAAITQHTDPADVARALGDAFADMGADQNYINECYRLAFYTSEASEELSGNPLYAAFLADRSRWVLDKWVHYFPVYTRHLERFRNRPIRLLEIGVYRGGGLALFSHYLGPQAQLVGLDIDEAAVRSVRGRFVVELGDQADPDVLRRINDEHGPFDVVIDDGGHTMDQQITTVETLFPLLNDGGVFIIEDTHTSYWSQFGGGLHSAGSFVEWSKPRIDDLHARHHRDLDRHSVWATELDGMHWHDSIVVLDKKHRFRPFNEVAGTSLYLWQDRVTEGIGIEMQSTRDHALREVASLRAQLAELSGEQTEPERVALVTHAVATEDELRVARSELARQRAQLQALSQQQESQRAELDYTRNELLESWEQIRHIRGSFAFRMTKPLRAVKRLLAR